MTLPEPPKNKTTHQLITEIEHKDRRFRLAQGAFLAILLLLNIGLLFVGYQLLEKQNKLLQQGVDTVNELKASNEQQTEYIKCIARFFNERNRTSANIASLDDCTITRADGSIAPPDNVPPDTQATSSTQFIPMAPTQPQPVVTVTPPQQNPTITVPTPDNPVTPPTTNPERPPAQVLGIPVCVPLTNVCVRR